MTTMDLAIPEVNTMAAAAAWSRLIVEGLKDEPFPILDRVLVYSHTVQEGAIHALCVVLGHLKDRWEVGEIGLDVMGEFSYDFHQYVRERTGHSYDDSHIDNLVGVGRIFLIDPAGEIPATVQLYDSEGLPLEEEVPVDFFQVGVSKLIHSKAAMRAGWLLADLVAMGQLMNPNVSVRTVLQTLYSAATPGKRRAVDQPSKQYRFALEGVHLTVSYEGSEPMVLCEMNWDGIQGNAVLKQAWQMIVAACAVDVR